MQYHVIDAFTEELFRSNPAGVCYQTAKECSAKVSEILDRNGVQNNLLYKNIGDGS